MVCIGFRQAAIMKSSLFACRYNIVISLFFSDQRQSMRDFLPYFNYQNTFFHVNLNWIIQIVHHCIASVSISLAQPTCIMTWAHRTLPKDGRMYQEMRWCLCFVETENSCFVCVCVCPLLCVQPLTYIFRIRQIKILCKSKCNFHFRLTLFYRVILLFRLLFFFLLSRFCFYFSLFSSFCCRFWSPLYIFFCCVRTMHNGIEIQSIWLFLLCEQRAKSAASCRVLRFNFIVLYLHTRCAWIIRFISRLERPKQSKKKRCTQHTHVNWKL